MAQCPFGFSFVRFPVYRTSNLEDISTIFEFPTLSMMSEENGYRVNVFYETPVFYTKKENC